VPETGSSRLNAVWIAAAFSKSAALSGKGAADFPHTAGGTAAQAALRPAARHPRPRSKRKCQAEKCPAAEKARAHAANTGSGSAGFSHASMGPSRRVWGIPGACGKDFR